MRRFLCVWFGLLAISASACAQAVPTPKEYKLGAATLESVIVAEGAEKKPGLLLAHEDGATSPQAKEKAAALAKLGFTVCTVDLYGKGVQPKDAKDSLEKAGLSEPGRKQLRARVAEAHKTLAALPQTDAKRIVGVGYGVGGTALLEFARSGAELEALICVHSPLSAGTQGKEREAEAKKIKAKITAIAGADDKQIPREHWQAFEDEMALGGVDWQAYRLGGVAAGFTNPKNKPAKDGQAFDPLAEKRAQDLVKLFLADVVTKVTPETKPTPLVPPVVKPTPPTTTTNPAPKPVASTNPAPKPAGAENTPKVTVPLGVPQKAGKVLEYVDENKRAPSGFEGGRHFGNFERVLPKLSRTGRPVQYQEWDVNPLRPGVNRGAERLVTGSDGTAYYTDDHYKTFKKIR